MLVQNGTFDRLTILCYGKGSVFLQLGNSQLNVEQSGDSSLIVRNKKNLPNHKNRQAFNLIVQHGPHVQKALFGYSSQTILTFSADFNKALLHDVGGRLRFCQEPVRSDFIRFFKM